MRAPPQCVAGLAEVTPMGMPPACGQQIVFRASLHGTLAEMDIAGRRSARWYE